MSFCILWLKPESIVTIFPLFIRIKTLHNQKYCVCEVNITTADKAWLIFIIQSLLYTDLRYKDSIRYTGNPVLKLTSIKQASVF